MKARVNTSSNSRNKSGIILSIGMIVKNEEKFLLNCLECLKPLMESVKSELVIVDTGSTDKTVEIAKKYTDKVYHFEWIHDFAAARNFGLEKCSGEWFMFLDADEHFADVEELIAFFNNKKLRDEYNTGTYLIRSFQHEYNSGTYVRNFQQQKENRYTAIAGIRIAKRYEGFGFEGAVHEIFKKVYAPIYHFKSYVNHYGYLYETEEDEKAKRQRNLVLLEKELEKKT